VGTGINLKSCVTTSSTGNITYKVYNGDFLVETKTKAYNEEYTFTPDRTGTLTIKVTQAADDNYEASSEKSFTVTVNNKANSNTGDWLSSTALTSYTLTVVAGSSAGTYTIKYGNTEVVSNVTSIKLSVAELPMYATVTANNDGYSVQESVFTGDGTTGVIQITSADLANCLGGNVKLYVHENGSSIAFKLKVE
jgi:hypothetical protein